MNLQIARCATGNPRSPCNPQVIASDPGNFSYYAGPVSVTRAAGTCISLRVRVQLDGLAFTDPLRLTFRSPAGPAHAR